MRRSSLLLALAGMVIDPAWSQSTKTATITKTETITVTNLQTFAGQITTVAGGLVTIHPVVTATTFKTITQTNAQNGIKTITVTPSAGNLQNGVKTITVMPSNVGSSQPPSTQPGQGTSPRNLAKLEQYHKQHSLNR